MKHLVTQLCVKILNKRKKKIECFQAEKRKLIKKGIAYFYRELLTYRYVLDFTVINYNLISKYMT